MTEEVIKKAENKKNTKSTQIIDRRINKAYTTNV